MKVSSREMVLIWITGVVALAGVTYMLVDPQLKEWRVLDDKKQEAEHQVANQQRLIAQAPKWDAKLTEQKKKLPTHPQGKDVTTDLQILIERLAKANGVNLISRDAGKETLRGNMYEVAVNCKWEGKLESLTRFLFDLQKEDVILDVSELTISPNEKKVLRGGFTVYCSYSRVPPPGGEKKTETKGPKNDVLSP
jgi:Tfp pilus assembly protein PilO